MPLLDYEEVKALRAVPVRQCAHCKYAAYRSYCRKCDVYCELGHGHLCASPEAVADREHEDHRHY
jgi:hypothetical protein